MLQILKNTTRKISMLSIFLCLLSCNFLSKETKAQDMEKEQKHPQQETIDDYTDTYTITPNYDMPRFKELMAQFNKQEHRFEIDTCAFKYNGQSFFIGDSVEKITGIFGEPEGEIVESLDKSSFYYDYKNLGFSMRFSSDKRNLEVFTINLRDFDNNHNAPFDLILFRDIPYQYEMKLNDFLELSDLDHTKLRHSGFSFVIRPKECAPDKDSRISNYILSQPVFNTKGGGHLTFSGNFNPNESNIITGFVFKFETLEDIKN